MAPVSLAQDFDAAEMQENGGAMGWLGGQQQSGPGGATMSGTGMMMEQKNNNNNNGMMDMVNHIGGLGGQGGIVTPTKVKGSMEEPPTTNYGEPLIGLG